MSMSMSRSTNIRAADTTPRLLADAYVRSIAAESSGSAPLRCAIIPVACATAILPSSATLRWAGRSSSGALDFVAVALASAHLPPPADFAVYIARSAASTSASAVSTAAPVKAMPMLESTITELPATTKGAANAWPTRPASAMTSSTDSTCAQKTPISSPPRRPARSVGRIVRSTR
jgi:hypothetical protein